VVVARAKLVVSGSKLSGRQSWRLLWEASRPLSLGVLAWAAADAVDGPLVVTALGVVVGAIPAAVAGGLSSSAGHRLIGALIIAALLYTASLILDPKGSLTGFFPGDAPVTWVGSLAGRLSGVIGCAVIAAYFWWLGLLLLVMWVVVRRVMLRSVLRQAIDVRGQTTETAARRARSRCSCRTASPRSAWPT